MRQLRYRFAAGSNMPAVLALMLGQLSETPCQQERSRLSESLISSSGAESQPCIALKNGYLMPYQPDTA